MFHFGCSSATGIHLQALVPVISILIYVSRSSLKRWFLMLSVLHQLVSSKGLSMAGCLLALSGFQWVGYSSPPLLTFHYISYLRLLRYLSDHAVKCIIRLDFCSFSGIWVAPRASYTRRTPAPTNFRKLMNCCINARSWILQLQTLRATDRQSPVLSKGNKHTEKSRKSWWIAVVFVPADF